MGRDRAAQGGEAGPQALAVQGEGICQLAKVTGEPEESRSCGGRVVRTFCPKRLGCLLCPRASCHGARDADADADAGRRRFESFRTRYTVGFFRARMRYAPDRWL